MHCIGVPLESIDWSTDSEEEQVSEYQIYAYMYIITINFARELNFGGGEGGGG